MPIEDIIHPWLKHYSASPQWAKSLVGGAYALTPDRWRHGREVDRFLAEAQVHEPAALRALVEAKLRDTLRWTLDTVPAYAEFRDAMSGDADPLQVLRSLPTLAKESLKLRLEDHVSTRTRAEDRLVTHTGGSTSIPMRLYLQRFVSRPKDYAYSRCWDQSVGIGRRDRVFVMRGRLVPGAGALGDRVWSYDPIRRFVHLSSDHLEPRYMPQYVAAMRQWRARFIQAFPSAIVPLAHWLQENPAPDITDRIEALQLYSENIYPNQVELLRRVFGCPVYLEYGHSERAAKAASVADDPRYCFWPSYGYVELLRPDGTEVTTPGEMGEIVATAFDNRVMPLLRYRTGDFATLGAHSPAFPGFLAADRIDGRIQEFLVCGDRRVVSICSIGAAHFDALAGAQRMQFEQWTPGEAVLKVLAARDLGEPAVRALHRGVLEKTQGGVRIRVERVDEIPRTPAGKHLLLIQHLDVSAFLGAAAASAVSQAADGAKSRVPGVP